jgi:hypothetical protein
VSRFLNPHAQAIADVPKEVVPQVSWGAAILTVTYRSLCAGVFKGMCNEGIFLGCP